MDDGLKPLTEEELDGLRAKAEAATPGPWEARLFPYDDGTTADAYYITDGRGNLAAEIDKEEAEYIAAADPPTVLRLIAEVRALRSAVKPVVRGVGRYDVIPDPPLRPLFIEGFLTPGEATDDGPLNISLTDLRRLRDLLPKETT